MHPPLHIQIRNRREQLGLTQVQAAERLGISQPAVARLESGSHPPSTRIMQRIEAVYRVRLVQTLEPVDTQ